MKFKIPNLDKILSGILITIVSALILYGTTEFVHIIQWETRSVEIHNMLVQRIEVCTVNQSTLKDALDEKEKARNIYYTAMFNKNDEDHLALMNKIERLTIQVKNLTWAVTRNNKNVEKNLEELKKLNMGTWVIAQPFIIPTEEQHDSSQP